MTPDSDRTDTDHSIDRLQSALAPDPRRPTVITVLRREQALRAVTDDVRERDDYRDLLGDVAAVVREETARRSEGAVELFGLESTVADVRQRAVSELRRLDLGPVVGNPSPQAAYDQVLDELARTLCLDGLDRDEGTTKGSVEKGSDIDEVAEGVSESVDALLFAGSSEWLSGHESRLRAAREAVVDRVLASQAPGAITPADARAVAVLLTAGVGEVRKPQRTQQVVTRLQHASSGVVRCWGHYVCAVAAGPGSTPKGVPAPAPGTTPLCDLVSELTATGRDERRRHASEAVWCLGRAMALTPDAERRDARLRALVDLLTDDGYVVERAVFSALETVVIAGKLDPGDVPMLFDGIRAAVTAGVEGPRRSAVRFLQCLADEELLTGDFVDRLLEGLVTDLRAGGDEQREAALGALKRLFETEPDSTALRCPALGRLASAGVAAAVVDATETRLYEGPEWTASAAGRVLREVVTANLRTERDTEALVDRLVDAAITERGERRARAATALRHIAAYRALDSEAAALFFAAHEPAEIARSQRLLDTAETILDVLGAECPVDLEALTAAVRSQIHRADVEQLPTLAEALATLLREREFADSATAFELLGALVDATARGAREATANSWVTHTVGRAVEVVDTADDERALDPLVTRLRSADPYVRRETVRVLRWGTETRRMTVALHIERDGEFLAGPQASALVDPLLEHLLAAPDCDGPVGDPASVLRTFVENGWLDDTVHRSIADAALDLIEDRPRSAATLLQHSPVLAELSDAELSRVFETYAAAIRPSAVDGSQILVAASGDRVPDGTVAVLERLADEWIPASRFCRDLPIAELPSGSGPSLRTYLMSHEVPTGRLLSLLTGLAARTDQALDGLQPPFADWLADGQAEQRQRLRVVELLTVLDAPARSED